MALRLLGFLPTMMINAPLLTEVPNSLPPNGPSLEATSEEDRADFPALLFLVLVAPQVQGFVSGEDKPSAIADGSVSQSCPETLHAASFFAPDDGSVTADYSPTLIEVETSPPSKNNLTLDFDAEPNGVPLQQDNADHGDAIVLFRQQRSAGTVYSGKVEGMIESVAPSAALGSPTAEKAPVVLKDSSVQLSSMSAREAVQIASFDGHQDDLSGFGISHSHRLNVGSTVSSLGWQSRAVQEQNSMLFGDNGKKGLGEEIKIYQDHLGQHPDLSLPFSSIARSVEERVKAGDSATSADWSPVVNRVAGEIISSVRHNNHEAFITLDPPELGSIKIAISLEGDRVHARILAEVHDSGRLIENHVVELKQALQLQSLDLVDLRVDSGNWNGSRNDQGQSFQQGFEHQQEWRDSNPGFFASVFTGEDGEAQRSGPVYAANGRVSVWA